MHACSKRKVTQSNDSIRRQGHTNPRHRFDPPKSQTPCHHYPPRQPVCQKLQDIRQHQRRSSPPTPPPPAAELPKPPLSHRTPKPSLSFRSRDKPSPGTPPSRPRGMTFPHGSGGGGSGHAMHSSSSHKTLRGMPQTPTPDRSLVDSCLKENEEDANGEDADSVVSFTPSTGGKNIAHWFSGLLGRS
ncbi:DUF4106 multi-domain protein [Pyrenophora tritici-repentis]|uniref:DUF4106 multi-domain protein n=1 Tax=Pyrenophora tritici-repentis TaxID=45151 RepID=A0A317A484_9PLEO|nr:DUF4106 multi-domain protein [Pyrenophora tritici-repentis]